MRKQWRYLELMFYIANFSSNKNTVILISDHLPPCPCILLHITIKKKCISPKLRMKIPFFLKDIILGNRAQ